MAVFCAETYFLGDHEVVNVVAVFFSFSGARKKDNKRLIGLDEFLLF